MAKFLIVEARFYDHLNDMLIAGARAAICAQWVESDASSGNAGLARPKGW